ncbi:7200_t:CDS:2 [Rhizophagus irregularis]|nr:7200_t:CDS:2 [Rhizophagus irregularis]
MSVCDSGTANPSELEVFLRQHNTELEAKVAELKNENARLKHKLERDTLEYCLHNFYERKNEQGPSVVDEQPQDNEKPQNIKEAKSTVDVMPEGFSAPNNANTKSTEDEEMITFLIEQHKKSDTVSET